MTLLTVLLHIWILWSLYGDKVTAGQNQINCLCCYPERSAVSKSCARYVQCGMKYNTSDRTECILGSAALCTCFCCDRDCYTKTVCPTINASICTRQIVYCINTTTNRFKPTSRSNNVEMSANTTSQNVFSSTDRMSHQMSYSSGQNHIPEPTATFSSITHVTMSPTEPSKFNQRILFALVGGLGGIIILLILSLIIMVQCVTLHRRRKMEEYPAIREGDEINENTMNLYSPLPRLAEASPYECPVTSNVSKIDYTHREAKDTAKHTNKEAESDEDDYAVPDDNIFSKTPSPRSSRVLSFATPKKQSVHRVHFAPPESKPPVVEQPFKEHVYAVLEKYKYDACDETKEGQADQCSASKSGSDDGYSYPIKKKCLENGKRKET